mgnify:CR=1 FL=1
MRESFAMSPPPKGAIVGEDVPRENEETEIEESFIKEVMHTMKQKGKPYTEMKEEELEEKAVDLINECGGGL